MSIRSIQSHTISVSRPEQKFDEIIGIVLRTGVLLAAGFVLCGGVLYLLNQNGPVPNYHTFHGEPAELRSVSGIIHAAIGLQALGLIQFGLLVLIATPIARVVLSVFAFLYERDWAYVIFTLIVLGVLLYSLFGGHK